jgi:hypothetical protein
MDWVNNKNGTGRKIQAEEIKFLRSAKEFIFYDFLAFK